MKRSENSWPILLAFSFLLATGLATAGVFARVQSPEEAVRLWKLDEEQGGIFAVGKVLSRQIVPVELPELGEVEVTRLEISLSAHVGSRAGVPSKASAFYLGGASYRTSAQPSDAATKPGAEAAFLLRPNPAPKAVDAAWMIDGQNAVLAGVRTASGELTLLGQGSGAALAENARAEQFLATHRAALARVIAEKGKK